MAHLLSCPACLEQIPYDKFDSHVVSCAKHDSSVWQTGNWSSYRVDGAVLLERGEDGWDVYKCDEEGSILTVSLSPLVFAPPVSPGPFQSLLEAQAWALGQYPLRSVAELSGDWH